MECHDCGCSCTQSPESRLLMQPENHRTEAELRRIEKYCELKDNGYIFQPVVMEVHGSLGGSSEIFITRHWKILRHSHDDQRACSLLKQRISSALQIGNAACVLGTVSDRGAIEEIYYILSFFILVYHCRFLKLVFAGRLR